MVRDLEIADLLRRSPRDLDMETIDKFIEGKRVLITGAAGSIGSELVRQCMKHDPDEVIALDQSENGLYNLKEEVGCEGRIKYILGDVTVRDNLEPVFESYRPQIIFHAAAYKHVPMLENNVLQAVINNIEGTRVVADMSDKFNVEKFVQISTDKAVRPSSVMGATKRVCELFIQNFNRISETEFVAVRFGNVLGSSGSVIPKFIDQIRDGGPVTVTHPETTRYFMLVSEAVQLVLQAAAIGDGGNIFILDMGSPVKITEMAEDLIYLMGREPYKDIEIEFTGLRPGEKIYEELFSEEIDSRTKYENITVAKATIIKWDAMVDKLDELIMRARSGDSREAIKFLSHLVSNGSFGSLSEDAKLSLLTPLVPPSDELEERPSYR
jgi:FlaA1/EpsC-like NDP-sugar epimerase